MKRILIGIVLILLLASCTVTLSDHADKNFRVGKKKKCNVGEVMITTAEQFVHYEGKKAELIYSGGVNNTLNITYREYYIPPIIGYIKSSIIRFPYSQYLQYDMKTDSTFTFQDLYVKVHEANSNFIIFTVTRWDGLKRYNEIKKREIAETFKKNKNRKTNKRLRRGRGLR